MAALQQKTRDVADDVHALVGLSTQHAVLQEQVVTIREGLNTIRRDLDGLHENFRHFRDELNEREKTQVKERKADRRWLVGTVIASTTVIVAALGIVASVLG